MRFGSEDKAEATTAVAHKLARLIYALISSKQPYDEKKAFPATEKNTARKLKALKKLAQSLNMEITPKQQLTETVI